jgi:hypothetical protein
MKTPAMSPETARCDDRSRPLLEFFYNGSLEPEEGAAVRAHLGSCAACAADLDLIAEVAGAIAPRSPLRAGPPAGSLPALGARRLLALAAALAIVSSLSAFLLLHRTPSINAQDAFLDLGSGAPRGEMPPPHLHATAGITSLRVRLFPPVLPGARYFASIVRGSSRVAGEAPLGPLDAMGGAEVRFPSATLSNPGTHQLVLRVLAPGQEERIYRYLFEVEPDAGLP